jgi:hypothetical protein
VPLENIKTKNLKPISLLTGQTRNRPSLSPVTITCKATEAYAAGSPLSPPAPHASSLFSPQPALAPLLCPVHTRHRRDSLASAPDESACAHSRWLALPIPAARTFRHRLGHLCASPAPTLPHVLTPIGRKYAGLPCIIAATTWTAAKRQNPPPRPSWSSSMPSAFAQSRRPRLLRASPIGRSPLRGSLRAPNGCPDHALLSLL